MINETTTLQFVLDTQNFEVVEINAIDGAESWDLYYRKLNTNQNELWVKLVYKNGQVYRWEITTKTKLAGEVITKYTDEAEVVRNLDFIFEKWGMV